MATCLRSHVLARSARVVWRFRNSSVAQRPMTICGCRRLPICQKALDGCTRSFSAATDCDSAKDGITTVDAVEVDDVSTTRKYSSAAEKDSSAAKKDSSAAKRTLPLNKLHRRQFDKAELIHEAGLLERVVQDLREEDSFGKLSARESARPTKQRPSRQKGGKEKPGKRFEYAPDTGSLSSVVQSGDLQEGDIETSAVTSEADVFGTLTDENEMKMELVDAEPVVYNDDEGEVDESEHPYQRLSRVDRRHNPDWYGRQIERLGKAGKIYEAIDMYETTMVKEDRVKPNRYVFTVLIGVLGRVGYTKKAFQLFNRMKKFGLDPEDPTYTALFNACSNSPWRADGLERATLLHRSMLERGYAPNVTTCHAMIKAYGVCGDLQGAFAVTDEMLASGARPDEETYSFLLMACISDREAGLKHAIEVWRRMRTKKVTPQIHHYNLLLRSIRDCGIGSIEFAQQLIRAMPAIDAPRGGGGIIAAPRDSNISRYGESTMLRGGEELREGDADTTDNRGSKVDVPTEVAGSEESDKGKEHKYWWQYDSKTKAVVQHPNEPVSVPSTCDQTVLPSVVAEDRESAATGGVSVLDMVVPNILNPRAKFRHVLSLDDLDTPTKRLALIGGMPGFLAHMKRDGVAPDIKTFTQLLDAIPSSRNAEADLLAAMSASGVTPDVDFFNALIRKRNMRRDYRDARDVFSMISQLGLTPNLHTFGCAAMGCANRFDGLQLLKDMQETGFEPNVEIYSILMFQSRMNFAYKRAICQEMKRSGVKPNENILRRIEDSVAIAKRTIIKKERQQPVREFFRSEEFSQDFRSFMLFYKSWLLSMELNIPPHPWHAYRAPSGGTDHIQDNTVKT